ncbi:MAG: carbohydrate kinase family protein [Clostridiales bacterium]|nr:carbohydrate kinase family protein [Candidatus Cacconaster stercorequi]
MEALVIGAVNMDIGAASHAPLVARDSNPGVVTTSLGGVGRNIAHNLCLLGVDTAMLTVLGQDSFADTIRQNADEIGLDLRHSATVPGGRTSTYLYIADADGDMALAVNDMDIYRRITPDFLAERRQVIESARLVVIDTNLPRESIEWLCENCPAPIVADPVSTIKAEKLRGLLGKLYAIKPNRMEAECLSGIPIRSPEDAAKAAQVLLDTGLQQVYISLSYEGIYAADSRGNTVRLPCPRVSAVNATGCGDAMAAGMSAGILWGKSLEETAAFAIAAGAFSATAEGTIHPNMSVKNIKILMNKENILHE